MDVPGRTPPISVRFHSLRVLLGWIALLLCAGATGCGSKEPTTKKLETASLPPSTTTANPQTKPVDWKNPVLRVETSLGTLTLQLDGASAPVTVGNFLNYASEGFYDDTIVHYVAPGKIFVAGGYTADRRPKPARTPIRNEAHNGLKNLRGTIAMTRDPALIDSATSQFFINLEDAPQRDHHGESADEYGYCVFGRVTEGLDVAEQIARAPTKDLGGDLQQTPDPPVVIKSIRVVP